MAESLTGADISVVRGGVVGPLAVGDSGGDDGAGGDDSSSGVDGHGDPFWDGDDDNPGF